MSNSSRSKGKRRVKDLVREMLLTAGEKIGQEYLIEGFLTSAMLALFHARRKADLSQTEVAKKLNTQQSAIARWEADLSGSVSLKHYAQFAQACGMAPLDITLVPMSSLRAYVLAHPEGPRTAEAYHAWLTATRQSGNTASGANLTTAPSSNTGITAQDGGGAVEEAERYLKSLQKMTSANTVRATSEQQPVNRSILSALAS